MKGIVLAGGLGKRLAPLTSITNKHLLPVYDRPMIFHPVEMLAKIGIKDILMVVGPENAGDFMRLLGNGQKFGLRRLDYVYFGTGNPTTWYRALRGAEPQDNLYAASIIAVRVSEVRFPRLLTRFRSQYFSASCTA